MLLLLSIWSSTIYGTVCVIFRDIFLPDVITISYRSRLGIRARNDRIECLPGGPSTDCGNMLGSLQFLQNWLWVVTSLHINIRWQSSRTQSALLIHICVDCSLVFEKTVWCKHSSCWIRLNAYVDQLWLVWWHVLIVIRHGSHCSWRAIIVIFTRCPDWQCCWW